MDPIELQPLPHQAHVNSTGQLPDDESYIERLFPKCQPKPTSKTANQRQFRNKRTMKAADRQQQYKRQNNRAKQHLQQQQQQQQQVASTTRPQAASIAPRGFHASTSELLVGQQQAKADRNCRPLPSSATSHELGGQRYGYNSSDSSDGGNGVKNGLVASGADRRGKPQELSNSNNHFQEPTGYLNYHQTSQHSTRHKTSRKYRASKNLQQQLRRSQSSYSKLFEAHQPPLPVDPSARNGGDDAGDCNDADKIPNSSHAETLAAHSAEFAAAAAGGGSTKLTSGDQTNGLVPSAPTGRSSLKGGSQSGVASRVSEKGTNRTNRGIVFAEPIATIRNHQEESEEAYSQVRAQASPNTTTTTTNLPASSSSTAILSSLSSSSNQANGESAATSLPAKAAATRQTAAQDEQQQQQQHHHTKVAVAKTADTVPSVVASQNIDFKEETLIKVADDTCTSSQSDIQPPAVENPYTSIADNLNQKQHLSAVTTDQRPISSEAIACTNSTAIRSNCGESAPQNTSTKLVNDDDDDRFINLFVYDNASPRAKQEQVVDKELDKTPLIILRNQADDDSPTTTDSSPQLLPQPQESRPHPQQHIEPQTQSLRASSQQLLIGGEDLNEEDIVSNDTSTEELCTVGGGELTAGEVVVLSHSKIKASYQTRRAEPVLELLQHSTPADVTTNVNVGSKSNNNQPKHHRSSSIKGTLQTVDEKAESNTDDEEEANNNNHSKSNEDGPAPTALDDSEAAAAAASKSIETLKPLNEPSSETMSMSAGKKAFVPPGFPQRVRPTVPTTVVKSTVGDGCEISQSSPTHVPSGQTRQQDNNTKAMIVTDGEIDCLQKTIVPAFPAEEDNPAATCVQLENLTEESQSAIEKNLSEALSKVSLGDMNMPTLRQLKLPNEASHFSAVRATLQKTPHSTTPAAETARFSQLQFNTLSDIESGPDDDRGQADMRFSAASLKTPKRHESNQTASAPFVTRYERPEASPSARVGVGGGAGDDDITLPATRTALVFPRLDEGLSSEAESGDDEVDDDDDKAMEADVDADDDDDDDDDEDDDDDDDDEDDDDDNDANQNINSLKSHVQSHAANADPSQQQTGLLKPQNRLIGSLQRTATTSSGVGQPRVLQDSLKSQMSHYVSDGFNHVDPETHDHHQTDELRAIPNYSSSQNGQPSYWMGGSQSTTTAMSSQPTSKSQLGISSSSSNNNNNNNNNNIGNNNNGNNFNLSRASTNNYVSREDVKTANRLSSDTDNETDRLLGSQRSEQLQKMAANSGGELTGSGNHSNEQPAGNNSFAPKQGSNSREVLIEGVLFNVKYLGSTHTECEGRGEKEDRIHQAELAVHEVKFRNGETHSPVEVQLFISTEKIMVLDDKHRKIMMDHSLRTISYIADIGDAIVLIVRKKSTSLDSSNDLARPISKTSCHVFESNESHTITKSISQAFQVAYTELLKANGGAVDGNNYLPKELDYQEVLNSQEMSMTELEMFARKDNQREVIVPKKIGEILGLSIVESGWGSVLPTAVIASLKQDGPAYRCKRLSIGDQILSINGISLVGLSLVECQKILRKTKNQSVARLSVVPCPITVEVKIKRPDTKYQLGFSVQHGVICSLLRGGIAERGGVRVGHRIISINGTTVVGVPHDKIVTLLASSVGEIRMKTCLTSLYRHMLGEEKNVSFV